VILDVCRARGEFLLNPNRFNVSITSLRGKLIVFMSEYIPRTVPSTKR
jgi:superfamily I DNA and/or RNA helicase